MKKLSLSLVYFIVASVLGCTKAFAAPVNVSVNLNGSNPDAKIRLEIHNGKSYTLSPNIDGSLFVMTANIDGPLYATVYFNDYPTLLWLIPDSNINISLGPDGMLTEASGDNADVNRFLNDNSYHFAGINDTGRDEADFIHYVDSVNRSNQVILEASRLPEAFKEQEKDRIFYKNAIALSFYPEFHPRLKPDSAYVPSADFFEHFKAITRYDATLMASKAYTNYIISSFGILSRYALPNHKGFNRFSVYLDSCVVDTRVKEYIFHRYATSNLTRNGIDAAREYINAYSRYVTDSVMIAEFRNLYDEILCLSPGQPSPVFDCETADGSRRTLSDYAGKWVYIDIWATWCGPCQREIPHLEKLEKEFAKKPLAFVSISIDTDRDAWVRQVEKQNMGGEQLHFDGKDTFCDSYKVTGIPRFILLDPEGRIVDSDMTRPSNPATVETLDRLLDNISEI